MFIIRKLNIKYIKTDEKVVEKQIQLISKILDTKFEEDLVSGFKVRMTTETYNHGTKTN